MKSPSLESDKDIIRQLAHEWSRGELPGQGFLYADYVNIVRKLFLSVQNPDRAKFIFMAVLTQAISSEKTSAWVDMELQFEKLAESIGCRSDLLLLELQHSCLVDDAALDLYNERVSRFSSDQKSV